MKIFLRGQCRKLNAPIGALRSVAVPGQKNSGQLAVGLALGFCCILAMFGLVFQSSLYTVDKTKLQTTSDYAVLIAANNEADNLNKIREYNRGINDAWILANAALQFPFCSTNLLAVPSNTIASVLGTVGGLTQKTYTDCLTACQAYDQYIRDKIMDAYNTSRDLVASNILSIIQDANSVSFDQALNIFLAPESLPHGMFLQLQHDLGPGFKLSAVKSEYEKGTLSNNNEYAYDILAEAKDDPLFIPKNEPREFSYLKYGYVNVVLVSPPQNYCQLDGPAGVKTTPSSVRVVRATDDTTYFVSGIRYTPVLSIIQKMLKIGVKDPDRKSAKFGADVDSGNTKDTLFRNIDKGKRTMFEVLSVAKPYGGGYPEAGFVGDPSGQTGSSGEKFVGSKLFGLADTTETQNIRVHRADGTIEKRDYQGNVVEEVPYYAEDFLH